MYGHNPYTVGCITWNGCWAELCVPVLEEAVEIGLVVVAVWRELVVEWEQVCVLPWYAVELERLVYLLHEFEQREEREFVYLWCEILWQHCQYVLHGLEEYLVDVVLVFSFHLSFVVVCQTCKGKCVLLVGKISESHDNHVDCRREVETESFIAKYIDIHNILVSCEIFTDGWYVLVGTYEYCNLVLTDAFIEKVADDEWHLVESDIRILFVLCLAYSPYTDKSHAVIVLRNLLFNIVVCIF